MSQDQDLYDSKEYKAFAKLAGDQQAGEFVKKTKAELQAVIATKSVEIQKVIDERNENSAYVKACEEKKAFDGAVRDTVKPMKVAKALATKMIRLGK